MSAVETPDRTTARAFNRYLRIDPLFEASGPARVRGASVTFELGVRTAWHSHPLGQTLTSLCKVLAIRKSWNK